MTTRPAAALRPGSWFAAALVLATLGGGCGGGGGGQAARDGGPNDAAGGEASSDVAAPTDSFTATIGGTVLTYAGSATMARTFANDGWMLAIVGSRGAPPSLEALTLLIVRRDGVPVVAGSFTCGSTEPEVTLTVSGASAIACAAVVETIDMTAGRARGTFAGMLDASTTISDGLFDVTLAATAP